MKSLSGKHSRLFRSLTESVAIFIEEVNKHNLKDMATQEWSVKDVLCHISYWHVYYAQNYSSLANGNQPFVFKSKGGSKRNQEGVSLFKNKSKKDLIALINSSQTSLYESIVIKKIPKMTYIAPREYKTDDFLIIITRHIQNHTMQIKRSKSIN